MFTLGAVAIAGLPPLNGFVSEWLVYLGLFGAMSSHGAMSWAAAPAAIMLCMTGALAPHASWRAAWYSSDSHAARLPPMRTRAAAHAYR
jgi:hydrogenase-4 component B